MASLPKSDQDRHAAVRQVSFSLPDTSTPEFEMEYRRQMAAIAEHDRRTKSKDRMDLDEDALRGWV
jgi:hypothetical protein